ncbi:MAG: LCP family protein [Anaerolineales bacterium]
MNINYNLSDSDPWAETRPSKVYQDEAEILPHKPKRRRGRLLLLVVLILAGYLFFPSRHTLLILGIDRAFEGTAIGRSDTNLLVGVRPLPGSVSILSIPRDLWVTIPGYGENRINTAHFFGENQQAGQGPDWAINTVETNFETPVDSYLRIQFENFPALVDAMGGIDLDLETDMAGYSAGTHHLDGDQALAFVRDRAGTDDFFRMAQTQVFLKSFLKAILDPTTWPQLPAILQSMGQTIDTSIPVWQFPRIGIAVLRAYLTDNINFLLITREDVAPWVTNEGAQVLLPNWPSIKAKIKDQF